MRGLPAPPSDVALVTYGIENDGALSSCSVWVQLLPGPPYDLGDLQAVKGNMGITGIGLINALTTDSTVVRTCRLRTFGSVVYDLEDALVFNSGAWTGSQVNSVASGIRWVTGEPGRRGWSVMFVPGFPDVFTTDHLTMTAGAMGEVFTAANRFISDSDAYFFGGITGVSVGTVHRQRFGRPLPFATFVPYVRAEPMRPVARQGKRLYVRR